jgi:hypothetical protein
MLNIDESIIKRIAMDIEGLCRDYQKDLNAAFLKADDALMVSFKSKISPDGVYLEVETSIEFTMEKIKGKTKHTCGGLQGELTFHKVEAPRALTSCPHNAFQTRDGSCSVLQYSSFVCMDRCRNGELIKRAA